MQQIESRDLTNTLVVVTRIFGGTKLGVGGLMRAYGTAASEVLDRATIEDWIVTTQVQLTFAYEDLGAVKAALQNAGVEPRVSHFGSDVQQLLRIPEEKVQPLVDDLVERTAARIRIRVEETPSDGA